MTSSLRLTRWTKLLLATAGTIVSLMSFPSAAPWLAAGWIGWYLVRMRAVRPAWPCLTACMAIVLVKRLPLLPGMIVCLAAMTCVVLLDVWQARRGTIVSARTAKAISCALLVVGWLALAVDWRLSARHGATIRFSNDRPIVCIGDSLTSGIGSGGGYPAQLQKLVNAPVVDLSQEGYTSADAIEKLLPAALAARPQAVVIELGGHDFLFDHPAESLDANLRKMIEACHAAGAEVVLMEIPRGLVRDRFAGIERRLARTYDLQLVSDTPIRRMVLFSPMAPPGIWLDRRHHLSDDGLHPNQRGSALLAREAAEALRQLFGPAVVAVD